MKIKIKDIDFKNSRLHTTPFNESLFNLTYNDDKLEFQTPKLIIDDILTENDKNYLILKIYPTQASKIFYSKIIEFEKYISDYYSKDVNGIFKEDTFRVKIPFKSSKPILKIYKDDFLFNYYHLCKGMEIICLLQLSKVWITESIYYNLTVNEILITKS